MKSIDIKNISSIALLDIHRPLIFQKSKNILMLSTQKPQSNLQNIPIDSSINSATNNNENTNNNNNNELMNTNNNTNTMTSTNLNKQQLQSTTAAATTIEDDFYEVKVKDKNIKNREILRKHNIFIIYLINPTLCEKSMYEPRELVMRAKNMDKVISWINILTKVNIIFN